MHIIDVCGRWPGSAHDATIFANSTLCDRLERDEFGKDSVLVADSAYAADRYVCKPLANPQTIAEKRYQKAQIKTRNIVERTLGGLKRMFPCLLILEYKLAKVQDVIVTCCILYNMMKMEQTVENPNQAERDIQSDIGERLIAARHNQRNPIHPRDFLIQNHFNV